MAPNTYTARAGNCVVRSFYPYAVRALSELIGTDIVYTYRQWQEMDIRAREWYMSRPLIAARMVELAEQDAATHVEQDVEISL